MDKVFLVEITIFSGEYEKHNRYLIKAETEEKADLYALYLECHSENPVYKDGMLEDLSGEFIYEPCKTIEVNLGDVEIVSKYLTLHEYNQEFIDSYGDWEHECRMHTCENSVENEDDTCEVCQEAAENNLDKIKITDYTCAICDREYCTGHEELEKT